MVEVTALDSWREPKLDTDNFIWNDIEKLECKLSRIHQASVTAGTVVDNTIKSQTSQGWQERNRTRQMANFYHLSM